MSALSQPSQPTPWDEIVARLDGSSGDAEGELPLGNKADPYDELIYILLTVMTRSQPRIDRAYDGLRELVGERGWTGLLDVNPDRLRGVLEPLGFVNRRTDQLLSIAARVESEHGGSLDFLHDLTTEDAQEYLTSLPGVGVKTAKCVLMYALERDVLPVDIHVLRVAKRLGLVPAEATWEKADQQLETEVPDALKFDVHVEFVVHGREVCKSPTPLCGECVLLDICPTGGFAAAQRDVYTGARRRRVDEGDY